MNDALELFKKLPDKKQAELIALITKIALDYQPVFAVLLKAENTPQ